MAEMQYDCVFSASWQWTADAIPPKDDTRLDAGEKAGIVPGNGSELDGLQFLKLAMGGVRTRRVFPAMLWDSV